MSTTPRTDAVQFLDQSDYHDPSAVDWFVRADFARELETELDAALAELGKMFLSAAETADRNVELRRRAEKAEAALEEQKWLKECAVKRTGEVMAERDALAKDTARMDWLEKESPEDWGIWSIDRATIDKAMKEASK